MDLDRLKKWFMQEKRDLPWRKNPTPYQVWISEMMLQQTQVAVVQTYYLKWMARFPSIESVAQSSVEEVVKLWEGLGYYSRARYIHQASLYLMEYHGGRLPSLREELIKIKGFGPYTVGAILSFAFHQKAAAVDGNVVRVVSRYLGIEEDVSQQGVKAQIWRYVEALLPQKEPWVITEALIELGALVCTRNPQCVLCPLQFQCRALSLGKAMGLPIKRKQQKITLLQRQVAVIFSEGYLLLKKGKKGEVMEGLYEFPYFAGEQEDVLMHLPLSLTFERQLPCVKQAFTRFRAFLYPSIWKASIKQELVGYEWKAWEEIVSLPFSSGHREILKLTFSFLEVYSD